MNMNIDWSKYLRQFDPVYEMQARVWQDGMALGNGSLGALAYEPFHPEWVINKTDVWDYRHPEFKRHTMAQMREIVAQDKNYLEEMNKENISGLGLYSCPKSCGQLRIRFGLDSIYAPGHRISKWLSLHEGTLHTNLDKHLSHPRITSFISAEEDIMVAAVRDVSAMTAFHNMVDLYRVPDAQMPTCIKGAKGDSIWIDQPFHDGFRYVMMARIVPTGGSAYGDLFRETVQEKWWFTIEPSEAVESRIEGEYAVAPVAGDFDIYLTVVSSLDSDDPMSAARERLANAINKGTGRLAEEHRRWWAEFWTKSYVALHEPILEQLWYVSLYNLATVLRGTPVGGLCGLWFGPMDTPTQLLPWMGSYTNDYNMQLPVMPVFRANHPELADGSFKTLLQELPGAMKSARDLYELPGALFSNSADPTGEEITNGPYRFCQGAGPYWCVFMWWHYLYTKDTQYLREITYPIMREVATFFVSYIQWHEDENLYHLEISQNPELMYVKYPDPIDTLSFLKYTLKATIAASETLGVDEQLRDRCQHVLDHYPPYPTTDGEIVPLKGLPANHINHLRTLAALFPCGEFDPEIAPEWHEMCCRDLEKSEFWHRNYGCNSGWRARGYSGIVYHLGVPSCRLGLKEQAWDYFESLLKTNVKPNGLIGHNAAILANSELSERNIQQIPEKSIYHDMDPDPLHAPEILNGRLMESVTENLDCRDTIFPAFEGPATYLLMVEEMLLQSHNGIIRVFPALPDDKDASFVDLRAEGPTLVSAQRAGGEVVFVRVEALDDVNWRLKNPWSGKSVWTQSDRNGAPSVQAGDYIELSLAAGESITVAALQENLCGLDKVVPRSGEDPQARLLTFDDGMLVWVGKPQPSRYYAALEAARRGVRANVYSKANDGA